MNALRSNGVILVAALERDDEHDAARQALRGFIDKIIIPAGAGLLQVVGNCGEMLKAAAGRNGLAVVGYVGCGGTQPTLSAAMATGCLRPPGITFSLFGSRRWTFSAAVPSAPLRWTDSIRVGVQYQPSSSSQPQIGVGWLRVSLGPLRRQPRQGPRSTSIGPRLGSRPLSEASGSHVLASAVLKVLKLRFESRIVLSPC